MAAPAVWRSLLYVPANNQRFIDKAHLRNADALILDLEDSVPAKERDVARSDLPQSIRSVGRNGADVLVRVNSSETVWREDLDAAVVSGLRALVLPKVESPEQVLRFSQLVSELEQRRSIKGGQIGIHLLVESPAAIFRVAEIAGCCERTLGLSLGAEDFAQAVGMEPSPETLSLPRQLTLYAARAAGIIPVGLMGSITDYADRDGMYRIARTSVRFGFEGATCIHPDIVSILNDAFTPTSSQVERAQRIVQLYEQACEEGTGAVALDGQMIDVPVAQRARRILDRNNAISSIEKLKPE